MLRCSNELYAAVLFIWFEAALRPRAGNNGTSNKKGVLAAHVLPVIDSALFDRRRVFCYIFKYRMCVITFVQMVTAHVFNARGHVCGCGGACCHLPSPGPASEFN